MDARVPVLKAAVALNREFLWKEQVRDGFVGVLLGWWWWWRRRRRSLSPLLLLPLTVEVADCSRC